MLCGILNEGKYCQMRFIAEKLKDFYIVTAIYTFDFDQTRLLYRSYNNFVKYISSFGVSHFGVEGLYPTQRQKFNETFPIHLSDTFYYRENLLNIGIR
jgi:hypothetical protein